MSVKQHSRDAIVLSDKDGCSEGSAKVTLNVYHPITEGPQSPSLPQPSLTPAVVSARKGGWKCDLHRKPVKEIWLDGAHVRQALISGLYWFMFLIRIVKFSLLQPFLLSFSPMGTQTLAHRGASPVTAPAITLPDAKGLPWWYGSHSNQL